MSNLSQAVSIHPYFKIQSGKEDAFEALMAEFVERTTTEETCYYYDFSICGDQAFCREAYHDAAAVLRHLENVGSCIAASGEISELYRLEFHGPAEEIDKLRGPLADLNPDFYVRANGVAN
ncbi:MAG: putative quinol monooxygenase [Roseibacillus sp.]